MYPPHAPDKENHFTAPGLWSGSVRTSFILLSKPPLQLIQTGKGEAIRIRSILRSLVPTEDLVGIISIPLKLPSLNKGKGSCWRLSPAGLPRASCAQQDSIFSAGLLPASYCGAGCTGEVSCSSSGVEESSPASSSRLLSPLLPCVETPVPHFL